jgi:ABC-type sugar transport system substrate-binding protein
MNTEPSQKNRERKAGPAAQEGLDDHPAAVYTPPPALDRALAELPLVDAGPGAPRRIGYLVNYSFHIWYQILMEIIRRRAAQYGAQIEVRDAALSVERQIAAARELLPQVDALILTPAATEGLEPILQMGEERGIPVVVEANPVRGMKTLVAICDYDAGRALGAWVGDNIRAAKKSPLRVLDLGLPTLRPCLLRSEGFIDGLRAVQPDATVIERINGMGSRIIAKREAARALAAHGRVDVIFAMDDETGQGGYEAFIEAGFSPDDLTLASFGLAGDAEKDWLRAGGALRAGAAMFPEYVAARCVDDVMRLYRGDAVQRRDIMPTLPMTAELLSQYYPRIDGAWTPDLKAIAAIPVGSSCARE